MKYDLEPKRSTLNSAGYDFCVTEDMELKPKTWTKIDTKVSFNHDTALLEGKPIERWFMMIVPRSSLGMNYGLRFHNTVGIIDADYTDSIMLEVTVDKALSLKRGDRICQGIILPYCTLEHETEPKKQRAGGLGSTGTPSE